MYTCGYVSLGGWEESRVVAQYIPETRWNGWIANVFLDAHAVEKVLTAIKDDAPSEAYEWDWLPDGSLALTDLNYLGDTYNGHVVTRAEATDNLTPDADGLYSLGSYGWVWIEDPAESL